MTDFRDDIERISKRRLTGKEKAILVALVLIFGSVAAYFFLPITKEPYPQPPVSTPVVNPEGETEPPPNLLERFNEELQSLNHPLRKLIEEGLGIDLPNRTVKRSGLALTALDPQGKAVAVQWDEYQHKKWGGFFFHETRNATIKTVLFDKRWIVVSCVDDHTGERVSAYAGAPIPSAPVDYVCIRIWNDETQQLSEFDESVCRFDAGRKNIVIVHGLGGNTNTAWILKMSQRIRKCEPEMNIIGVDWDYLCETTLIPKPIDAANQIPDIVKQADSHLFGEDSLNLEPSKTHVIGFSHGSHIAGMMGMKHPSDLIGRLTVLDPSTRSVHLNWENLFGTGWGRSAAKFVDMYASSTLLGTKKRYGHKTYFVEEKKASNFTPFADHNYAAKWFLSTIGNNDTRFGYSIDVTQNHDSGLSGTIRSSLPKKGVLDGVDDKITNEIEKSPTDATPTSPVE